jgi:hypothetical protein
MRVRGGRRGCKRACPAGNQFEDGARAWEHTDRDLAIEGINVSPPPPPPPVLCQALDPFFRV